jgi:hypothetical protein
VPEEPSLPDVIAERGELLSRLRAVVEAKESENAVLRQEHWPRGSFGAGDTSAKPLKSESSGFLKARGLCQDVEFSELHGLRPSVFLLSRMTRQPSPARPMAQRSL